MFIVSQIDLPQIDYIVLTKQFVAIPICLYYHTDLLILSHCLPILSSRLVYVYQLVYMFIVLSPFPNIIPS
jgi:hypothetical protein